MRRDLGGRPVVEVLYVLVGVAAIVALVGLAMRWWPGSDVDERPGGTGGPAGDADDPGGAGDGLGGTGGFGDGGGGGP